MTCACCAMRIEKRLNRLDGVTATVNYATERAKVDFPADVDPAELVAAVEAAGYTAALPATRAEGSRGARPTRSRWTRRGALRDRLVISALLTLPVLAMAMIPALQFENWQWLSLTLAAPVVVWGAWPFHRAAWANLRHGTATMDTLISVGTLAAFGWSLWALFFGDAGEPGHDHAVRPHDPARLGHATRSTWRSPRRSPCSSSPAATSRPGPSAAPVLRCAPCWSWAPRTSPCCATGSSSASPSTQLAVGDRFVVRPGEKVATDGVVEEGTSAIDASLLTGESVPVEVGPGDAVTGATVNAGGRLVVRATRVGADTQLAQIARLVTDAQNGKAPVQRLADRVSAVFVPVVIALAVATLGFWLGAGAGADDGVHRRGGGADHRLPVRPRPGHAHRAAGRHRPGRPAGHPHQGPRGARVDPAGRHDRAGQDRHGHHRADDPRRRRHQHRASTRRRCCASSARSRTPPSTPSPRPSPAPPATGSAPCPRWSPSTAAKASACRASSTATPSSPGGPSCSPTGRCTCRPSWKQPRRPPRPRGAPPSSPAGTARSGPCSSSPTR